MYPRLLKAPLAHKQSFFLFGPRGTGKTSWLRRAFPDAIYLDFFDTSLYVKLETDPSRLRDQIPEDWSGTVILDEVQRIPEVLNEVQRLLEEPRAGGRPRFILSGSSARSLRRKGVNLLAGRALTYRMHPLTLQEVGKDFVLEEALLYGMLPMRFSVPQQRKYLLSYIETYVREEVVQEGLLRNLGSFYRFLETASFSQAQLLNITEVAREASINRKLAEAYFNILDDILLATRLPPFLKKAKRNMTQHSKFFFFDAGVWRALRPSGPYDKPEESDGVALETLFFQEARALNDYLELEYDFFYWRTATGREVDFVLYGQRGIKAFEIKRSHSVAKHDLAGCFAFLEDYPEAKVYVLFGGKQREYFGPITCIPFQEALASLPELLQDTSGITTPN